MAPSALIERQMLPESDVWAVGVVLWEIITLGATPYSESTESEIEEVVAVYKEQLPCPSHVPPVVFRVCQDCWGPLLESDRV